MPLAFTQEDFLVRICLLFVGSPGSGTELQCTRIVEKYPGTVHIPLKAKVRQTAVHTVQGEETVNF